MKHFFYAVYVLFYTGALFLAGMFVGQFLERTRMTRRKKSESAPGADIGHNTAIGTRDRKVTMMRKRE